MRRLNFFYSVVVAIALPLMIITFSSALVLNLPSSYQFHFNDSQAINRIQYNLEASEVNKKISLYLLPVTGTEFQLYEDNGDFKDPVFTSEEQQVMRKLKKFVAIDWGVAILSTLCFAGAYYYLYKNKFKEALRNRYRLGIGIFGVIFAITNVILLSSKLRHWLYNGIIGVNLPKKSTLTILLGDPSYQTYCIFFAGTCLVVVSLLSYMNFKLTKPERIFY